MSTKRLMSFNERSQWSPDTRKTCKLPKFRRLVSEQSISKYGVPITKIKKVSNYEPPVVDLCVRDFSLENQIAIGSPLASSGSMSPDILTNIDSITSQIKE